ncbi:hypothetical protein EGW08_014953 [Elysia chlorotica]|uniref:RING-type domain-containing protein n=1 Tax=Elysia chlorotica TaxID=188477 RepID=A0A3S1BXA9_ELYCH|nr:hypothetical protein EGW08_014953 [Elysia chlorotica]
MISFAISKLSGQDQHLMSGYNRGLKLCFIALVISQVYCDEHHLESDHSMVVYRADIKYTYKESKNGGYVTNEIQGRYGSGTQPTRAKISGQIVHITSLSRRDRSKTDHFGCEKYTSKLPPVKWIALVERGECRFTDKLRTATLEHNASALVVYDNQTGAIIKMEHKDVNKNVAVFISRDKGLTLVNLLAKGVVVEMEIHRGGILTPDGANMNNSSVLFVSISFIIIVIISVAWLMFYYIRKFRYSHAKERLAKRLARAAKKAIAKIPQRTVNVGDKELDGDFDQCAICIEPYKDGDIIRLMPCRHVFHKSCVDPWLLDHRTCPMCKLDILQAFGMSTCKLDMFAYGMQGSQESMQREMEGEAIMLESIHSVDGAGRSESTALVLDDHEASSSLEDEVQENSEVKIVLVPPSCLHYHHSSRPGSSRSPGGGVLEKDEEEDDTDQEASTGLLTGAGVHTGAKVKSGSTGSLSSALSGKNKSGWGRKDGEKSVVEMEALIHPSGEEREECDNSVRVSSNFQQSALNAQCDDNKQEDSGNNVAVFQSCTTQERSLDPAFPLATNNSGDPSLVIDNEASKDPTSHAK